MSRNVKQKFLFKISEIFALFLQNLNGQSLTIRRKSYLKFDHLTVKGTDFRTGIVFQGPLINSKMCESLIEYVNYISKNRVVDRIVISTWNNAYTSQLISKCNPNVQIVVNEDIGFDNNLERQMYTTYKGLEFLRKDVDFAIKLRVDQKININAFNVLFNISYNQILSKTIVFTSLNSYLYRSFGLSDMLNLGRIESMILFWNPHNNESFFDSNSNSIKLPYTNWANNIKSHWNESFLNLRYAVNCGMHLSMNAHADYLDYLARYVVIVDSELVEQTWSKYKSPFNDLTARSMHNMEIPDEAIEITQSIWFAIRDGNYIPPNRSYNC